jgi:LuxR family maltose regulon positive regulatory protein
VGLRRTAAPRTTPSPTSKGYFWATIDGALRVDEGVGRVIPRGKTTTPLVPADFVARPELFAEFDAPGAPGLGLVSAPAGYGKTMSLAGWAAAAAGATAWVSLDHHDDAHVLWSAILTALVELQAIGPGSDLHDLVAPRAWETPTFLGRFCDALEAPAVPITLVLDDVHEVDDTTAMDELRSLVRYRPHGLRLLLASRLDPPLSLPRLRLQGQVWDLRADRLAFTTSDTAILAHRGGLSLTAEQTSRLQLRTGGWAAGLRLAMQAMRTAGAPDDFLAAFSGDDRSVADYLVGEVLDTLPVATREFLTLGSLTDPLPAALAVEITGRADAVEVLVQLARDTSLLVALEGDHQEFRILELLRTYLDAELHRSRPGLAAGLHVRTARWWAARDQPVAALDHAARGDDPALLTDLVERFALRLALIGNHRPVRRALAANPGNEPAGAPRPTATSTLSASLVREDGDVEGLRDAVAAVLAAGSSDEPVLEVLSALGRGLDDLLSGGTEGARVELEATLDLARRHGFNIVTLQSQVLLAAVAAVRGDYRRMAALSSEVLGDASASAVPWEPSVWTTLARTLWAYAALYRAEPEAARAMADDALRCHGDPLPPSLRHALHVVRGAARADAGERTAGLREIQHARIELAGHPILPAQAASAALLEQRTALQLGLPADAADAAAALALEADAPAEVALMDAWSELDRERDGQAADRVEPVLDGNVVPLLPQTGVEAHLLQATLAARRGDQCGARRWMRAALATAEPIDLVRPFARGSAEVGMLLANHQDGTDGFPSRALAAYRRAGEPFARARLTEREIAVLALLPSLLSADEIAAALRVSRSTVKTHIQTIYTKFGVQTRRAAVLTARERGHLPPADRIRGR